MQPSRELIGPVADFAVSVSPPAQNVASGTNTIVTVTISGTNGFSGSAALSVDGLPEGITANFNTNSISGSSSATLTFSIASDVDPATYIIPVTASSGAISHSANVALTVHSADSDSDGIPDWWMLQNFGHATGQAGDNSRSDDDADGDGMPNWVEYLCSTDPANSTSYLHLFNVQPQGNDQTISWSAIGGVSYVVQSSTNLAAGFNDISSVITPDQDGTQIYVDAGAKTNSVPRFYRIRLGP
jgi:hypothetical protein